MRRKNKKGYTLAELLIVVAIIGILVAVSIPIFMSQLRKAKLAVDLANARAGKAAMVAYILTYPETYIDGKNHTLCYDASTGSVVTDATTAQGLTGYGKTSDVGSKDDVDGLLYTSNFNGNIKDNVVTGTFYVDGGKIANSDENSGLIDDENRSTTKIIGDQIQIEWMPVITAARSLKK